MLLNQVADLETVIFFNYLNLYVLKNPFFLLSNLNTQEQNFLSDISEGVYFLTIQQEDNLLFQDKLIIIK